MTRGNVAASVGFDAFAFPERHPIESYHEAISKFVQRVTADGGVSDIYQIGSVGFPGVSDIDLVVVMADGAVAASPDQFCYRGLEESSRYLFMHGPVIVDRATASSLCLHFDIGTIRAVFGSTTPETMFASKIALDQYLKTSILIDFCIALYRQFVQTLLTRKVNVRPMLCLLHSGVHSINLARSLGLPEQQGVEQYVAEVKALRASCFDMNHKDLTTKTVDLIVAGVRVIARILGAVAATVLPNVDFLGSEPSDGSAGSAVLTVGGGGYLLFTNRFNPAGALEQSLALSFDTNRRYSAARLKNRETLVLPRLLVRHFGAYSIGGNGIAQEIAARFVPHFVSSLPESAYRAVLTEKVRLADMQAQFLARGGFPCGQVLLAEFVRSSATNPRTFARRVIDGVHRRALMRWGS